jgi:hypothetical protein
MLPSAWTGRLARIRPLSAAPGVPPAATCSGRAQGPARERSRAPAAETDRPCRNGGRQGRSARRSGLLLLRLLLGRLPLRHRFTSSRSPRVPRWLVTGTLGDRQNGVKRKIQPAGPREPMHRHILGKAVPLTSSERVGYGGADLLPPPPFHSGRAPLEESAQQTRVRRAEVDAPPRLQSGDDPAARLRAPRHHHAGQGLRRPRVHRGRP